MTTKQIEEAAEKYADIFSSKKTVLGKLRHSNIKNHFIAGSEKALSQPKDLDKIKEDLKDKIEEIQLRNYNTYIGTNEADLAIREETIELIAPYIQSNDAVEFAEWLKIINNEGFSPYDHFVNEYSTTEELYQQFKETRK